MWKTLLGLGSNIVGGAINSIYSDMLNEKNAKRNQHYWNLQSQQLWHQSEKSAENALKRQYQLYNELQSPKALVQQYKEAGLNPALLYGMGGGGGHVSSAPQGQAQSGQGAPTLGTQQIIDPLTSAQIANIMADTKKKEQEVKNVEQDTLLKKSAELLNSQAHNQNQRKFEHELGILIANQAIQENESDLIPTKNKMTNKQLKILEDEAMLKQFERELQQEFKAKGWDLSSMDGFSSALLQLGDKLWNLLSKWEIKLPEWMKIWK